jgi:hypothetical protein
MAGTRSEIILENNSYRALLQSCCGIFDHQPAYSHQKINQLPWEEKAADCMRQPTPKLQLSEREHAFLSGQIVNF